MPGVQRILAQNRNKIATAVLAASSVAPISNAVLALPSARSGNASIALSGTYAGTEAATYDVEITDTTVSTPLVSSPIFVGTGSGTLTGIASTGAAQSYTVTLADLGAQLTAAGTDFEGVKLVAKVSGAAGNAIQITVDRSGLAFAAQPYSLLSSLSSGSDNVTGSEWDWDTKVMGADGLIPTNAHRCTFGTDTTRIYRQYKVYDTDKWRYHFVPAIVDAIPAGKVVNFVTGGRTITVTNGTTTETYTGIATVFDFLDAVKRGSALIDVQGIVANDRTPTGQAMQEFKLRTDAYALPSYGSGSRYAMQIGFTDVVVHGGAPTELITATCYATTAKEQPLAHVGAERWMVKGSVSGDLGELVTGVLGQYDTADLRIPQQLPTGYTSSRGKFSVVEKRMVSRSTSEVTPEVCPVSLEVGPSAFDQTVTLVYTKRPAGTCTCEDLPAPNLRTFCLTGELSDGGSTMSYSSANITRLTALYNWAAATIKNNSAYMQSSVGLSDIYNPGATYAGTLTGIAGTEEPFVTDLVRAVSELESALGRVQGNSTAETNWDTIVTAFESEVTANLDNEATAQTGTMVAGEALTAGDFVLAIDDGTGSPKLRRALISLGGMERTFFVLTSYSSGATATYYRWGTNNAVTGLTVGSRYNLTAATPGAIEIYTGASSYATPYAISATELIVPKRLSLAAALGGLSIIVDRYRSEIRWVLASAGIVQSGKSDASTDGDGCWQDLGDAYYWSVTGSVGGAYAPAFNNAPYYASKRAANGGYYSVHEFAFQINIGSACVALLKEGDTIVLAIGDAGWPATYQTGDVLYLPVVGAQALQFAGGADGDNIETWYVAGSFDGAMPAFTYNPASPAAYSHGGLTFSLSPGAIPFAKGDEFLFAVEGGHFRWRKNGGSWSSSTAIPASAATLDSGLSITFTPGATPSFVSGDTQSFKALQPHAASLLQSPSLSAWGWSGAGASIMADMGASTTISACALAYHTLPAGATITLEGGADGSTWLWSEMITYSPLVAVALFSAHTARYLRLTVASASGGSIGWWWAGDAWAPSLSGAVTATRAYRVDRAQAGVEPAAQYLGRTISGQIAWSEGAMSETDMADLIDLVDACKAANDAPLIIVPQAERLEAWLARIVSDEVQFSDVFDFQPGAAAERRLSATIPFAGVVAQ